MAELNKPMFPLEDYAHPVRKMVVESMQTEQIIRYSFSSPTAARIVQEANICITNIIFLPSTAQSLVMILRIGSSRHFFWFSDTGKQYWTQFSAQMVSGATLQACGSSGEIWFTVTEKDVKLIIGLVMNHLCTVFQWTGIKRIQLSAGYNVCLLERFLSPEYVRTVANLDLQGEWTVPQFEKVMQCLRATEKVDMSSSAQILRREHLLMLTTPDIKLTLETPWQFGFIVNTWAAGEAFHNLERLEYEILAWPWKRDHIKKKTYLKGINVTEWVAGRRPRFLCDSKALDLCEDLRDAPDVYRADGQIGTIFVDSRKHIRFRVWRGDESVEQDKEAMMRLLENREKEYNKRKEEMLELNKRMEKIDKKKMRKSQKTKETEEIEEEKEELESTLEDIEEEMDKIREIITQLA